jgi:hypothetical protein
MDLPVPPFVLCFETSSQHELLIFRMQRRHQLLDAMRIPVCKNFILGLSFCTT